MRFATKYVVYSVRASKVRLVSDKPAPGSFTQGRRRSRHATVTYGFGADSETDWTLLAHRLPHSMSEGNETPTRESPAKGSPQFGPKTRSC